MTCPINSRCRRASYYMSLRLFKPHPFNADNTTSTSHIYTLYLQCPSDSRRESCHKYFHICCFYIGYQKGSGYILFLHKRKPNAIAAHTTSSLMPNLKASELNDSGDGNETAIHRHQLLTDHSKGESPSNRIRHPLQSICPSR